MKFDMKKYLNVKYLIHIVLITVLLLVVLRYVFKHDMLSLAMGWKVAVSLAGADIIAETLLGME